MPALDVEIPFAASHEGFAQGFARLRAALDEKQLHGAPRHNVELIFEEIVANMVRHGAVDARVPEARVTIAMRADEIVLTIEDDGVAFDPTAHKASPSSRSLHDEREGGFGILLVRRAAASLSYSRTEQHRNRLVAIVRR